MAPEGGVGARLLARVYSDNRSVSISQATSSQHSSGFVIASSKSRRTPQAGWPIAPGAFVIDVRGSLSTTAARALWCQHTWYSSRKEMLPQAYVTSLDLCLEKTLGFCHGSPNLFLHFPFDGGAQSPVSLRLCQTLSKVQLGRRSRGDK